MANPHNDGCTEGIAAPNISEIISIVIPVYNEEDSIKPLFEEISKVMQNMHAKYKIIFVNDCSSDTSPSIMGALGEIFSENVNVINLNQHRGQTYALKQGLNAVEDGIAVTLDADLQNDPADIPILIAKMKQENYDVVCGWRKARQDKPAKAVLSKFGNILQRMLTGMRIHDVSCTLRVYKAGCIKNIPLNWEGQHRFIPLSLSLQGFRIGEMISHHRMRQFGSSKYNHKRIFKVVIDFFKILFYRGRK